MKYQVAVSVLLLLSLSSCGIEDAQVESKKPLITAGKAANFSDLGSGLPTPKAYGNYGALWGDFNNDNLIDLIYMGHGRPGPLMLMQKEGHVFVDMLRKSGLKTGDWDYQQQADRHGGSCGDFNNDGVLDLYIAHGANRGKTLGIKRDELLQGRDGFQFEDVAQVVGATNAMGRARMANWVDYNNDGHMDLYISNFKSANVMYMNTGKHSFVDMTAATGLGIEQQFGAFWADYDQDGNLDVLLSQPLALFRNKGDGSFEEVTLELIGKRNIAGFGLGWADMDNDGDLDIVVSQGTHRTSLYVYQEGVYKRAAGLKWADKDGEISAGVALADFDNDSNLDIFQVRSDGYVLFANQGELQFATRRLLLPSPNITERVSGDAAVADFNGDGLLDVAIDDLNGYSLLKNQEKNGNHWLGIKFLGESNNSLGLGNKVWVSVEGRLLAYRDYSGNSGILHSQGCAPLHIGLGRHTKVDVKVQWLNGKVVTLKNIPGDRVITITDEV